MLGDKVILVTGASKGIGQATALTLADYGAHVVIHGRNEESITQTAKFLESNHKSYSVVTYDVSNEKEMKKAYLEIKKQFGRLDGLVNNAGIMHEGLIGMLSATHIQEQMQVNVVSVYLHIQYAVKLMKNGGSIVNLSSIMGSKGAIGGSVYSASKAALNGLTLSAAKELAAKKIRVNAVAPGFIETELTAHYQGDKRKQIQDKIGLGRFGNATEIANVIMFLMSDLSSYVTGQVIGVDGGMVI